MFRGCLVHVVFYVTVRLGSLAVLRLKLRHHRSRSGLSSLGKCLMQVAELHRLNLRLGQTMLRRMRVSCRSVVGVSGED